MSPSRVEASLLAERRRSLIDRPWFCTHQVHSDRVVRVGKQPVTDRPVSPTADGLVTTEVGIVLAVHAGDCVPVGFVHASGAVATAHAGWKGLAAGVLESTVRSLRSTFSASAGQQPVQAVVGPHIRAPRYEFDVPGIRKMSRRLRAQVEATTLLGTPGLDLTAGVEAELSRLGVEVAAASADCTATDPDRYWSHRARNENGRIALMAWIDLR